MRPKMSEAKFSQITIIIFREPEETGKCPWKRLRDAIMYMYIYTNVGRTLTGLTGIY